PESLSRKRQGRDWPHAAGTWVWFAAMEAVFAWIQKARAAGLRTDVDKRDMSSRVSCLRLLITHTGKDSH
ncbi:MAG: hypothetical protein KJ831_21200, partial [Candidatus Eisenbacteria bacterium]|nr:hypothetical protein [Candidatus Eisenbacteria bacterium]